MMLSSRERTLAERDSDDDDLSSTSTVMSEMKEEYPLEKILAERLTENGPEWLVKWEGYPDERSTWEAKTSFTTDEPLFDWQAQKMRIDRGYEKPYDVAALEARMNGIEEARAIRKARRRAKRLRLGISVSPDESNYESSEEAEESDDEVPLERPIRSRQGSLRQRRSSLEGFVVEDDQNVRKATKSNSPQKKTEVRKRSSGYKSDDRLSDDSLFEDFKIAEFNKTHKRLKKGVKPRGEDVPSRSPVKPSKPIPQPQADRRRSMPSLQPPQYSGNANQPKSRLKGAAGTGPKRYIKKQPQTTKRKVQGAAILGNWTASVKPRKRAVVVPGATPSSGPKTFNKLSVKRRFEKASRNEPAPNPEDLVFINLKIGKVVKPSPAPLPRPSVPAQKPWEIIQQRLNKEAKEAGKTKKPSLVNPSLDDDTPMDVDTMESLAQLQQLADVPPQVKQPAMSRGRADSTQRLQTIEQSKSETVQQNLPSTGSDWVHEAVPKPSDLIVSDAPGNLPGPKRRDNDDNVSSAAPGFQRRSSNSLYSGWGHPPDPESMSSHVLATVKVGYEGREVGAVRMKGLDKASKARLLRTKEEGRVEIWFKDFCTADDYRRFFCGVSNSLHLLDIAIHPFHALPLGEFGQEVANCELARLAHLCHWLRGAVLEHGASNQRNGRDAKDLRIWRTLLSRRFPFAPTSSGYGRMGLSRRRDAGTA